VCVCTHSCFSLQRFREGASVDNSFVPPPGAYEVDSAFSSKARAYGRRPDVSGPTPQLSS
jgi:hypothetical protein